MAPGERFLKAATVLKIARIFVIEGEPKRRGSLPALLGWMK